MSSHFATRHLTSVVSAQVLIDEDALAEFLQREDPS